MPYPDIRNLRAIIPRKDWGAAPPKFELPFAQFPVPYVAYSFTGTASCRKTDECRRAVKKLQEDHMAMGMPDIRSNFIVCDDLYVYEGRGWHAQPSIMEERYKSKKGKIFEIAYLGHIDRPPNDAVIDVRDALVMYGFENKYLDRSYFLEQSKH